MPQFASVVTTASAQESKQAGWAVGGGVAFVILICLGYALFRFGGDTVSRLSSNRRQANSMANLQKIAKALNAYAADYGTFPPPYTTDANAQPMHSWRVLILPYLGRQDIYDQFDLTKPWDDTANWQVANMNTPDVYRHPEADPAGYSLGINYCLITGPGTLFPPGGPLGPEQITDKVSQTLLVIDGIPDQSNGNWGGVWTSPIDLDFTSMQGNINGMNGIEAGGLFDNGATAVTVDGRPHFLPDNMTANTFDALVTPNGGEALKDDTLD